MWVNTFVGFCDFIHFSGGLFQFNMEQRRREQEHHEKQQELQQLKHKDKSQQSEYLHTTDTEVCPWSHYTPPIF